MSIVDNVKDVAKIVKQIDNIELYKKILDLQAEAMKLVGENTELKNEIRSLKEKLSLKETLKFRYNVYWRVKDDSKEEGPFCSKCWDTEEKLVHMIIKDDDSWARCPACRLAIEKSKFKIRSFSY
jgi:regulator of replication initiation timing